MNKNETKIYSISFPQAKGITVSGDIHGDFNQLVFKLCVQYEMRDTVLIVAGDCGFGFEKKGSYESMVKRNNKRMTESNNWIVFVRGNHDNPAYFDGNSFKYQRFVAVPDYTIIQACSHTLLCVGGAISIDRQYRIEKKKSQRIKSVTVEVNTDNFARELYWPNEAPFYDEKAMDTIRSKYDIDIVITHTAPSFCEMLTKGNLSQWMKSDANLKVDVDLERATMDALYKRLIHDNHPVTHWYYGHFHQSWHCSINNLLFRMLDIMEFTQI